MSDLQQQLQAYILDRLQRRKGNRLTRAEFVKAKAATQKQFRTDAAAVEQAIEALLREQYVSRTTSEAYHLEAKGAAYLDQLKAAHSAPPPEINDALLPYQKAFVLMQMFCAKEQRLTRSELTKKAQAQPVLNALLFARMSSDPPVNPDHQMLDWVVGQLVARDDLKQNMRGAGTSYRLTDSGKELLVASDQYPKLRLTFSLTSEQFKELLDLARTSSLAEPIEAPAPRQEVTPTYVAAVPVPNTRSPSDRLTPEMVVDAFEELRRERFARNGIVPVYELRRLLIARHGAESGSHAALDTLLKQMRREKQLRMIAIGDLSEATTDQLDDSVPGENETFFYLEVAHEYAHAR